MIILLPLYNDWDSAEVLINNIKQQCLSNSKVIVVNDGSSLPSPSSFENIEILDLNNNMGHQRSIAIGLSYIYSRYPDEDVIVMDSDGEDRPEDIEKLLGEAIRQPETIIFAKRAKRKEKIWFRLFYQVYKLSFFIATGKKNNFGNFCYIPSSVLGRITNNSDIWNHFSGGIIKSKLSIASILIDRGERYKGRSKMNFSNLVLHGLSAISIYIDVLTVRLLLFFFIMMSSTILGICIAVFIRFFSSWAIPGWASYTIIGLMLLSTQAFLSILFLLFFILNYRNQKLIVPAQDYRNYIK